MSAVRFLVADSSPAIQTFTQQLLVQFGVEPGWIACAATPDAALTLARETPPDFVLTDSFSKHPIDGMSLVHEVRQLRPDLRWAMTSAADADRLRDVARAQGALFFLGKPFTAADMKSALSQAMHTWVHEHPHAGRFARGTRKVAASTRAVASAPVQTFKMGDAVEYLGVRDTVRHVIFRRGELVVQLAHTPGIVSADKLRKL